MEEEEQLFDMIIPPGVPRSMLYEIIEKFDVTIVKRPQRMRFANMDGDVRELLAFRGRKEVVEEVHAYLMEKLAAFITEE